MPDFNAHSSSSQYEKIFTGLPDDFQTKAFETFKNQFTANPVYRAFVTRFCPGAESVKKIEEIPFLPVSFFKKFPVKTGDYTPEMIFQSSGTSGEMTAAHPVKDIRLYRESFVKGFEYFYGDPADYCILGLLPAYLERTGSSLVYMVNELIGMSKRPESGFYLNEFEKLKTTLQKLEQDQQKTLLLGVSFGLLDFTDTCSMNLTHTIVMETGGMKGRREEITREALHDRLKEKLGVCHIHSEYGMTELLSQAYSSSGGIYRPVPWMKMFVREEDDPLSIHESGEGLLNIIDLANRDSCSFLATDDVVRLYENGSFEILGRMDNSDIRGCSLLVV
jgi:hypothetical protein